MSTLAEPISRKAPKGADVPERQQEKPRQPAPPEPYLAPGQQPKSAYPAPQASIGGPSVERYNLPPLEPRPMWVGDDPPREYRFTIDDFHRVCDLGLFDHCKVELINGRIFVSPMPAEIHWYTIHKTRRWAEGVFPEDQYTTRTENAIHHRDDTEAGPDVIVCEGSAEVFLEGHPRRGELIVEVAHFSQAKDHGIKMRRYAATGTPDYWVIDVVARNITLYRDPQPDPQSDSGYSYASRHTHGEDAVVSPLAMPEAKLALSSVLAPLSLLNPEK